MQSCQELTLVTVMILLKNSLKVMNKFALCLIFVLSLSLNNIQAQCVTNYASSSGLSGVGNTAVWTSIPDVTDTPDGSGVEILSFVPMNPGLSTSIIGVWDFGLAIPCNATIDNVSFTLTRRNNATSGDVRDENFQLKFGDFTFSSVNAADVTSTWTNMTGSWETATYNPAGGWGTTLTPELLNDPLFGLIFSLENFSTTEVGMPEVDAIEIEVCYTVIGVPAPPIQSTIATTVDNLCDPTGNGSFTISSTGGTGIYEYSIDGGATWSLSNSFDNLPSGTYDLQVRDTDMSCIENIGPFYIGCNSGNILQVGDAIYTCLPTSNDPVTLAIDRIQPLNDFYTAGQVFDDVSDELQAKAFSWTTGDLGGSVFGVTVDGANNIYTGLSSLYNLITPISSADLIQIDGATGNPVVIATLPGTAGIGQLEYQTGCEQIFSTNLDDGMIYRHDPSGVLLSTYDPLAPDDGVTGLAPLGERVVGLAYNYAENRLYYSVWSNDAIDNGTRNTVRSVAIDPVTCDFVAGTDLLEVTMPFVSETENSSSDYSSPVIDIEFDLTGTIMLLAESGFNSTIPAISPHLARTLRYDGSTATWTSVNVPPAGNQDYQYQVGTVNDGTNSLGGIDFAYAGMSPSGCVEGEDTFVVSTGDALKGVDCTYFGCIYGIQYMPLSGGRPETSVLVDLARSPDSQQKGFFGDIDVVNGCCPCACPIITFDVNASPDVVCSGNSSTLCVTNPLGGTAPYTYLWDTAEVTDCITVTPATSTTYSVTVTDDTGCSGIATVTVDISASMTITDLGEVDNTDCTNDNGSITPAVSGGADPLQFSIDGGSTFSSSNSFTALGAGTYNVVVQDANGCEELATATLQGPSGITIAEVATTDDSSCSVDDGSITITASGGTAPLSYSIDGGATSSANNVFTSLGAGTYDIVVEGATGCQVTDMAILTGPGTYTISVASTDDTSCTVDDGTITITATGGVAPLSYSIDGGATTSTSNAFTSLGAGTYNIVVTDANNCDVTDTATLAGPSAITMSIASTDDMSCSTDDGTIIITATGGTAPLAYSIDGGITTSASNSFTGLGAGTYDIIVTDANNCEITDAVTLAGPSTITLAVAVLDDTNCNSPDGSITITVTGGTGPFTYSIDGGVTTSPNNVFSSLRAGTYDIIVLDANGCSASDPGISISAPVCNGAVGDFLWEDIDGNGIQDPGEPTISDIRVELYNHLGNLIAIQITDSNGQYYFDDVPPGDYYVRFIPGDEYTSTFPNSSGNTNSDSDVDGTNGEHTTPIFTLGPGEIDLSRDYGVFKCAKIGELVWFDLNENSTWQNNENGINGLKVELYRNVGPFYVKVETLYTDHKPGTASDDGYFKFCVAPGEYYVKFNNPPNRLVAAMANIGSNENIDSDVTGAFGPGTTDAFMVESGDEKCDIGAGFYPAGTIGDFVWQDNNADGQRDATEPGVRGVEIQAINLDGEMIATATSDSDGRYMLDMLPQDQYYVQFNLPTGYTITLPNEGTDDTTDSDVDGSNGPNTTQVYTVRPGDHVPSVDAGLMPESLPVTWVDVTVENMDKTNKVEWQVSNERNVSRYEIQVSNGTTDNFLSVDFVESVYGTYSGTLDYSYNHLGFSNGVNYYRVKQVDLDETFSYSKVVSVNNSQERPVQGFDVKIFPNPVLDELNVGIDLFEDSSEIKVSLIDHLGRMIADRLILDVKLEKGYKVYNIDVNNIPAGVYSLEIIVDNKIAVKKIAITK